MRKLITIFSILVSLFLAFANKSFAIENPLDLTNNKFGIHVLDTSEIDGAAELVNSSGGDWGYITIPIQAKDRDKDKWQNFMHEAKNKHLIPILRITTLPMGGTWQEGRDTDLVDFANFLGDLDWPVKNRYVIIFNEVNRSTEWGGAVEPAKYARILKNARTIFKERSDNFFILPAGLDNALPSSSTSMRAQDYLRAMMNEDPAIWSYIDGWNSHSYPNPGFSAPPTQKGWTSIVSYKTEIPFIKIAEKPIFITETGWVKTKIGEDKRSEYMAKAMSIWNLDRSVVAVTPFLLNAGAGDFVPFSFIDKDGKTKTYETYFNFPKTKGQPTVNEVSNNKTNFFYKEGDSLESANGNNPNFRPFRALLKLENMFRQILSLPTKKFLKVNNQYLTVEVAENAKQWEKGLSGKESLVEGSGMYFVFPKYHVPLFWMKDMLFPIDIIWIKDDTIVDFSLNVQVPSSPNLATYSPKTPVNRVLEVPAGYVEKNELQIGHQVTLINN